MPHFGTLRDYKFKEDVDDIRGANLYGVNDEKLGAIDDVIFDHTDGKITYVVVDTGGWLSSKKFLVPADRIHSYEKDRDDFQVDLLKQHVERFPRYDEKMVESERDWRDYEERYRKEWQAAPVQHIHGSDRNITPPSEEIVAGAVQGRTPMGEVASEDLGRDLTPHRMAGKFPSAEPSGSKVTMSPEGTATRAENLSRGSEPVKTFNAERSSAEPPNVTERWKRFEDLMRRNRQDIQSRCRICPGERKIA